ncbi:MAG TPA: hypothetical protein VFJ13_12445 [Paracoccaceae bacterium]|nr:hypothetical protein [Paracoccaceae bacterium]
MQIRTLAATLVLGTAAAVTATAAGAQAIAPDLACGSREEMTDRLKQSFGEAQTGLGLISAAQVLEVWSSDETGTWTILMTDTDGQSCLVAAGESWKTVPVEAIIKGEPA